MHTALAAVPRTSMLQIAGAAVLLRCDSAELHRALEGELIERAAVGPCAFTIAVEIDRSLRAGQKDEAVFRGRNHLVVAMFGEEIFTFDLRRRRVCARISVETAQAAEFWRKLLIPIALGLLGPTFGLIPVHAAALAGRKGLLLVGNSGAGKSTLTVALAKLGWSLVSDDWSYISATSGLLSAHGVNAPVKLLPDAAQHFAELRKLAPKVSFNGEMAFEVDAKSVLGISTEPRVQPDVVVFISRNEGRLGFQKLGRDVMERYFRGSLERLPVQFPAVESLRSKMIEALSMIPAYKFAYSGTPAQGAARLDEFLKEPLR
jgi:hypothetical protein